MNRKYSWFGLLAVLAALVLAACGGSGSGSGDSASTATQSVYADSTVGGYGSIVVSGVHYDESNASVILNDAAASTTELKLGMTVQLSGTRQGNTATAANFVVNATVAGAVGSVNVAASSFTVYGMTVVTGSQTIFDGISDLSALQPGSLAVAYGPVDYSTSTITATRVEVKPAASMGLFVDSGTVSNATATTFDLGGITVDFSAATLYGFPGNTVSNGARVVVRAGAAPVGSTLTASSVRLYDKATLPSGTAISAQGPVHAYVSSASFMVNHVAVDASTAQFVNGTAADLANGKFVQLAGSASNNVLVASTVTFAAPLPLTVKGPITDFISTASFRVRGVPVDASTATFSNGTASDLVSGRLVQLQGSWSQGKLTATSVSFTDTSSGVVTVLAGSIDSVSLLSLKVKGVTVVPSAATVYENGSSADLVAGAYAVFYGPVVDAKLLPVLVVLVPAISAPHTVYGVVSDVSGSGASLSFRLNGLPAGLDAAAVITGGTAANIQNGSVVQVTGSWQSSLFDITAMTLLTTAQQLAEEVCNGYALSGPIYNYTSASSFSLYGFGVDASAASFVNGTAADLANGKRVRVCGKGSASGTQLQPMRVELL